MPTYPADALEQGHRKLGLRLSLADYLSGADRRVLSLRHLRNPRRLPVPRYRKKCKGQPMTSASQYYFGWLQLAEQEPRLNGAYLGRALLGGVSISWG